MEVVIERRQRDPPVIDHMQFGVEITGEPQRA
jgi:hypothetical protein